MQRPQYAWWLVLCLVGLDYFSSLAYLPSIALAQVRGLPYFMNVPNMADSQLRALAPVAAFGVVFLTLFAALPIYLYVVGRSAQGQGAVGLIEKRWRGWAGKLVILLLLGFIATDFVLTRALSTSDAASHIQANPYFQQLAKGVEANREGIRDSLPEVLRGSFFDFWNGQLLVSVALSIFAFGLYFYLVRNLGKGFLSVAVSVVVLYLLLNALVIGSGLMYLMNEQALMADWEATIRNSVGDLRTGSGGTIALFFLLALVLFPPMAIGLSGFELTLASAPLVRGAESDDPRRPGWRIFNTRLMIIVAALIMCVYVLSSIFVVTLLVPNEAVFVGNVVHHRALSHLAHGGVLTNAHTGDVLNSMFGPAFGTLYDLSTVIILVLAGASATISMKDIVPDFLSKFGMQLGWAHKIGVITHLFNVVILVVTVFFRADVSHLMWGYATSVLALLFGASLAALIDVRVSWKDSSIRWLVQLPFLILAILFGFVGMLVIVRGPSGVAIAAGFVVVVMLTAIISRWLRGTDPRFHEFELTPGESEEHWKESAALEFQVLVPLDPSKSLAQQDVEIRHRHRLAEDVPILFIDVELGDPSDFLFKPLLTMVREQDRDVIRISRATSLPHALAAVAIAFSKVGRPPELHFPWAEEHTLAAMVNFVLLGHGNTPAMVREILRKAEPDEAKRPSVVVG